MRTAFFFYGWLIHRYSTPKRLSRLGVSPTRRLRSLGLRKRQHGRITLGLGCGQGRTQRCAYLPLKDIPKGKIRAYASYNGMKYANTLESQTSLERKSFVYVETS